MMAKKKTDPLDDLISQKEAAEIRGVSRASINELIKRGRLTPVTVAGKALLRRSEVESFEREKPGPKTGDER
jgi:excisionase family DNA binding protein